MLPGNVATDVSSWFLLRAYQCKSAPPIIFSDDVRVVFRGTETLMTLERMFVV